VNPDVDGYTRNPNQRKILLKMQKDGNLLKTIKRILKLKYKLSEGLVSTFTWPGESNHPSYSTGTSTLK